MKPSLKKVGVGTVQPIELMKVKDSHFYPYWHFHPQCEIMIVKKSQGTRYVGDNIENFKEGDVVLLGPDIPHLFRNDKEHFEENTRLKAEATTCPIKLVPTPFLHVQYDSLGVCL